MACGLAVVADRFERHHIKKTTKQDPPTLRTESAWDGPLKQRPSGTVTHVWLRLANDIEFRGQLGAFGHEIAVAERELVLVSPIEVRYPLQRWQSLRDWQRLILQGDDIQFLAVTYPQANKQDGNAGMTR